MSPCSWLSLATGTSPLTCVVGDLMEMALGKGKLWDWGTHTGGCTVQDLPLSHSCGLGNRKRWTEAAGRAGHVGCLSPPGVSSALSVLAPAV